MLQQVNISSRHAVRLWLNTLEDTAYLAEDELSPTTLGAPNSFTSPTAESTSDDERTYWGRGPMKLLLRDGSRKEIHGAATPPVHTNGKLAKEVKPTTTNTVDTPFPSANTGVYLPPQKRAGSVAEPQLARHDVAFAREQVSRRASESQVQATQSREANGVFDGQSKGGKKKRGRHGKKHGARKGVEAKKPAECRLEKKKRAISQSWR